MHIKKFEARSMKEALDMIKSELGPQAIILSVKDYGRKYGLVGDGSVEVTAAVSEGALRLKNFTESKLREQDKEKIRKFPARTQAKVIEKFAERHGIVTAASQNQSSGFGSAAKTPVKRAAVYSQQNTKNAQLGVGSSSASRMPSTQIRYADIPESGDLELLVQEEMKKNEDLTSAKNRIGLSHLKNGKVSSSQTQSQSVSLNHPIIKLNTNTSLANSGDGTLTAQSKMQSLDFLQDELSDLKNLIQNMQQEKVRAPHYPGSEYGLSYESGIVYAKLKEKGLDKELAADILLSAEKELGFVAKTKQASLEAYVARWIMKNVAVNGQDFTTSRLHFFMGPPGQGKTSMLLKMASYWSVFKKKNVAILSLDNQRLGSSEQLKIYAQILNVPFRLIHRGDEWRSLKASMMAFDLVLVDCPGLSIKSLGEIQILKNLLPDANEDSISFTKHLVLAATLKDADAFEITRRYSAALGFDDVIFTCLDQSSHHGLLINFGKFKKPLCAFGIGPEVPEDFEYASVERILDLMFQITKSSYQEGKLA